MIALSESATMLIKRRRRHSSGRNKAPPSSWLSKSRALTLRKTCQWFLLLKWWPDFYSLLQFVSKFSVLHGSDHVVQRGKKGSGLSKALKALKFSFPSPKSLIYCHENIPKKSQSTFFYLLKNTQSIVINWIANAMWQRHLNFSLA